MTEAPDQPPVASSERTFAVDSMSRVEGEGRLRVVVRGGEVVEAELSIFEAPRFFERLVVGRTPDEVLDIVARICGICPVAYQVTPVEAFERLFDVRLDPAVRELRRLFYWAEWLQSHALHVYLLNAPDFMGYDDALEMAREHRSVVERGLALKKAGVRLLDIIGGRAVHPVSLRVGGFTCVPPRSGLRALLPELEVALDDARETVRWTSGFTLPAWEREPLLLSLRDPECYALDTGRLVTSEGVDIDPSDWETAFVEEQVAYSTALRAKGKDGRHHLLGPAARIVLSGDTLHPVAKEALADTGGIDLLRRNLFAAISARSVEMVHAIASAIDIIDSYSPPDAPATSWEPRAGRAAWSTEAPRGLLFHAYEVDETGHIASARIVPPTSQNQASIEDDLRGYASSVLHLPESEATARLEAMIRCYDPCISCSTHFLRLEVERVT
ncbi:MAG: Ni/Fe hydrogenase subunit alpha [Chloroflexota bacterium]